MADERIYTIPLRKEFQKVKIYQRAKKAVKATRQFLIRHMKTENVLIGKYLHEELMSHGRKHPPPRVQVRVWKEGEKVKAVLVGAPEEKQEVQTKESKKGGAATKQIEPKIIEHEKQKAEQKEKQGEEKEQVLEHKKVEHKERHTVGGEIPVEKKVSEKERHMRIPSHSQKPTHEKKK